jgi:hypothetical protein
METTADFYYRIEKETLDRSLILLNQYQNTNNCLRARNWLFISPLFFQGFELTYINKICTEPGPHPITINQIIFNKFFDLGWTASFVEGYCDRCDHIKPFLPSIEHSLISTFQRDYEAGIKTLIPIVEGILRRYLFMEQSVPMEKIAFKHLKKSISDLKYELIDRYRVGLSNRVYENNLHVSFTTAQATTLLTLQTDYYQQWFAFLIDFIENSFYLNTHQSPITNQINRHAILHEYGLNFFYNLENYIKVYFVLQFLVWIFLLKEGKSLLNEIDNVRLFEKVTAYQKIIRSAEDIAYQKHILLKNYLGYEESVLQEKFNVKGLATPIAATKAYDLLTKSNELLWRHRYTPK